MRKLYLFLLPLFALAILVGCASEEQSDTASSSPDSMNQQDYSGQVLSGKHTVILHTSLGDITVELDADAAPKTVTNFVALAKEGYYDNLTFHRVIPDFMIQGGDPNGNGTGGQSIYGANFEDEINARSYNLHKRMLKDEVDDQGLPEQLADKTVEEYYEILGYKYDDSLKSVPMDYGYIAMANRGPNTNGSQFFIIQRSEGTPWLEGKHTVFGHVTEGMDVVDTIANADRGTNDLPQTPITFTVEVVE
jgi:peptidyl-prolyl cis-trans isomerase B (cyclophilin B)